MKECKERIRGKNLKKSCNWRKFFEATKREYEIWEIRKYYNLIFKWKFMTENVKISIFRKNHLNSVVDLMKEFDGYL